MPGERQPTLPALETLVPPNLLDPATQAVRRPVRRLRNAGRRATHTPTRPADAHVAAARRHCRSPSTPDAPSRRRPPPPATVPAARRREARCREHGRDRRGHPRGSRPRRRPAAPAAVRVREASRRAGARADRRWRPTWSCAKAPRRSRSPRCAVTCAAGCSIERVDAERFDALLREAYEARLRRRRWTRWAASRRTPTSRDLAQDIPEPSDLLESEDDAPVIRLINALLTQAVKENALGHPHRAVREPARGPLPRRRRAARGAADQARGRAADRLAHQGHVAARHRREAPAAGRPHLAAHRRPRGRRARLDDPGGPRRARRAAPARQAGGPPRPATRSAWTPTTQQLDRRADPQAERHPAGHRARPAPARPRRSTPRSTASTTARATS